MKLNVQSMTVVEKLQAMEMLWDDLCRNVGELEPPAWQCSMAEFFKRHDSFKEFKHLSWHGCLAVGGLFGHCSFIAKV